METARGRWFVAEFARRNKQADTERVLDALSRIERRVAGVGVANAQDPDIVELAAIFAIASEGDGANDGLTADVVADIARESGGAAETIRDRVLAARGALKGLSDGGADERLCTALDKAMVAIDQSAAGQQEIGRKIEALAQIIGATRDRVRRLLDRPRAPASVDPWIVTPEIGPAPVPPAAARIEPAPAPLTPAAAPAPIAVPVEEPVQVAPADAFESGLRLAAIGPGARLRLAIADEEQALRDLALNLGVRPEAFDAPGLPRTLAALDRLSYAERHALFAA